MQDHVQAFKVHEPASTTNASNIVTMQVLQQYFMNLS